MTVRQQVIRFAKMNHFAAKPMCGGVHFHKAHGADFRADYSRPFDNWEEAGAYIRQVIDDVQAGRVSRYPWDVPKLY